MAISKIMFSSNSDEWATPQEVFDELNKEFDFNLDPCATSENHKCDNYYTKNDDGLRKSWGGGTTCFATLLTAILRSGLRRRSGKQEATIQQLYF